MMSQMQPLTPEPEPVLYQRVDLERGRYFLTLNRPNAKNTLNEKLVSDLIRAFERARDDGTIKSVIFEASQPEPAQGKKQKNVFCGGIDLKELASKIEENNPESFKKYIGKYVDLFFLMEEVGKNKPIFGAIEGDPVGFGLTLTLLCTHSIGSKTIRARYPEKALGFIPWISAFFAARSKLGLENTVRMIRDGYAKEGTETLKIGAVNQQADPHNVLRDVLGAALIAPYAGRRYLRAEESPQLHYELPESPDKYDFMAQDLVEVNNTKTPAEIKQFLVDKFTEEMLTPEMAKKIRGYLAKLPARKPDDHTELEIIPFKPPRNALGME